MPNLLTYTKFYSTEEANEFTRLLNKSGIEFEREHERYPLDKIYAGETLDPMISVKIPEDRFEDVNKILLSEAQSNLTDIDSGYYLLSFSDQELIEVLQNKNEWNHFDQALAQKLLSERKVETPPATEKISNYNTYRPHTDAGFYIFSGAWSPDLCLTVT